MSSKNDLSSFGIFSQYKPNIHLHIMELHTYVRMEGWREDGFSR